MNKNTKCTFCTLNDERIIHENEYAVAIRDGYPVTKHHSLVIPRRHVYDYLDITDDEILDCHRLLNVLKREILLLDPAVQGFNVGVNTGEVAGQTIMHAHIHLIPRRINDVDEPRGGIRHLIPGKGSY